MKFQHREWHYCEITSILKHHNRDFSRVLRIDDMRSVRIKDADILTRALKSGQSLDYAEMRLRRMLGLDPEESVTLRGLLNRLEYRLGKVGDTKKRKAKNETQNLEESPG